MDIWAFLIASALLTLMPGPDIVFVVTQSVLKGARCGISIALGLCSGLLFHTLVVAFGISALVLSSPVAFNVIKYMGVAYLLYLGISPFFAKKNSESGESKQEEVSTKNYYLRGVMMNILNPKVGLFFIAFLPQFITSADKTSDIFLLGGLFALQGIVIFTLVALFAGFLSKKFKLDNLGESKNVKIANLAIYCFIAALLIFQ